MRNAGLEIRRARGFLLIVAILLLVVVALAVVALGNMTSADILASSGHAQSEQAHFGASSGLEYSAYQLRVGGTASCAAIAQSSPAVLGEASFTTTTQRYNPSALTLTAAVNPGDTTITALSGNPIAQGYAPHGRIQIDSEQINYTGLTSSSFVGLSRGVGGSSAAAHGIGAALNQDVCFVRSEGASRSAKRVLEGSIGTTATGGSDQAMVVYGKSSPSSNAVYYRTWDTAANNWSAEAAALPVFAGTYPLYIEVRYARTRNEAIVGILDSGGNLWIQYWNGSVWTNPAGANTRLATGLGIAGRGFQIEYEYTSDRALVVYSNAAGPKYATWNGSTWSAGNAVGAGYPGTLTLWFQLAAKQASGSNEIMMITMDNAGTSNVYGAKWDGAVWNAMGTTAPWDTVASTNRHEAIDVAYESLSGRTLFVWGSSAANWTHKYAIWDGTIATPAWVAGRAPSNKTAVANGLVGGGGWTAAIYDWIKLFPRPDGPEMIIGFQDMGPQITTGRWDGSSAWGVFTKQEKGSENSNSRNFDGAWQIGTSASKGNFWLFWGSGVAGTKTLFSTNFASPATWSVQNQNLCRSLFVPVGVLPTLGTFILLAYESSAGAGACSGASGTANSLASLYQIAGVVAGAMLTTSNPPVPNTDLWAGPTTIQNGEQVNIGVKGSARYAILEVKEVYP